MSDLIQKDASVHIYIRCAGEDEAHKINVRLDISTFDELETRHINRRSIANAIRAIAHKVETT